MARPSGLTLRVPLRDNDDDIVGWVIYDRFVEHVNIQGSVYVPAEFMLRLPGDSRQPSIAISYMLRDGAPLVTAVSLEAKPEGRRVQRSDLEGVAESLHHWSETALKAVMTHGEVNESTMTLGGQSLGPVAMTKAASVGRKRANQKVDAQLLREVAALYNDNIGTGKANQAIRDRFGKSAPTADRYIKQARIEGYLPPTEGSKK